MSKLPFNYGNRKLVFIISFLIGMIIFWGLIVIFKSGIDFGRWLRETR